MHRFVRQLLTEWRKLALPFGGETLIVAVSGGADSVSLALALETLRDLKKLRHRFVLVHFDHDLRGAESEDDAAFVRELAEKLGFESVVEKGNVAGRGNLEQNARRARYEFLCETARRLNAFGLLTAHTVNDQAETLLLNLIRGSGIDGLAAMKAVVPDFRIDAANLQFEAEISFSKAGVALVRPLLSWATRAATEDYCRQCGVRFRLDAMNEDLNFRRVRIRKILIPALLEFNPKIVETLARTARLLQNENETSFDRPVDFRESYLVLKDLRSLSKPSLYNVLREWLRARRGSLRRIETAHLEALERLISSRKSGRLVELPGHEVVVKRNGKLFWKKKNIEYIE